MDRAEAYRLAREALAEIASDGYAIASEHIENTHIDCVASDSGSKYEVELTYLWNDDEHQEILVICRVTSKSLFSREQVEESVTLRQDAV